MVGHNNLRKWKCKTCGMSFNFKKLLQMHTRVSFKQMESNFLLTWRFTFFRLFMKTKDRSPALSVKKNSLRNTI